MIFKDPLATDAVEVGWQTADDYLSGDVRSKLRVAQTVSYTHLDVYKRQ